MYEAYAKNGKLMYRGEDLKKAISSIHDGYIVEKLPNSYTRPF